MSDALREAARCIGFGATVARGGRTIHVQTEVFGEEELKLRSSVMADGAVLSSLSEKLPPDLRDLEALRGWVERRHREVVAQATLGKFDPS